MAGKRKSRTPESRVNDTVDAPFNYLYTGYDAEEDRLVTALMLASEELAKLFQTEPRAFALPPTRNSFAEQPGSEGTDISEDYGDLVALIRQINAHLVQDDQLRELLSKLPRFLGDGAMLPVIFRQLFPDQPPQKALDADGRLLLSDRQVEILREAAAERSQKEIAQRLGITTKTVNSHFDNIYRKLGVQTPMQAVARAISMGYLEMDTLRVIASASHSPVGNYCRFSDFLHTGDNVNDLTHRYAFEPMIQFGLLLLVFGKGLCHQLGYAELLSGITWSSGVVYELDSQGHILRAFGSEVLREARALTVAPESAAQQGFHPGHLYVVNSLLPQQGLNTSAICEFTPSGEFVRSFCGEKQLGANLYYSKSLTFTKNGRLLVGTSDGVLEFRRGGVSVQRFTPGSCQHLFVGPSGLVFMTQHSSIGNIIRILEPDGREVQSLGGTPAGVQYNGIAVNRKGEVFVIWWDGQRYCLEKWEMAGQCVGRFPVPGGMNCPLSLDSAGRLYVPCHLSGDIKVVSSEGAIERRIPLPEKFVPYGMTVGPEGRMWVSGVQLP